MGLATTIGELRRSGYIVRPVKDEIRSNLIQKLERRERLFPGIIGYQDTVVPALVNAILARGLLRRCGSVNKQIFMVTDGKPSAIFDEAGRLYKNSFGLDPRIVNKTLDEAVQCRREKIAVSTFMVARDPYLINFVEEFTRSNQGRAYYSDLNRLGESIFVDYLRNRRKRFSSQR